MDIATLSTTDPGEVMRTFTVEWEVDGASGCSDIAAVNALWALHVFYTKFYGYRLRRIAEGNRFIGPSVWMGGARPRKWSELLRDHKDAGYVETLLARDVFRAQCEAYIEHWGDLPLGMARILWTRARYSAHATIRDMLREARSTK